MELNILFSKDPAFVLSRAGVFLSSQPVHHNLILAILHASCTRRSGSLLDGDSTGRYCRRCSTVATDISSYADTHGTAGGNRVANAIAEAGVALPGVNGEAATAATFAGQWSERTKSAVTPFQGNRLYEFLETGEVPNVEGKLRQAGSQERSLMILWSRAFQHEIGESADDIELRVDKGLTEGQLWVWDRSGEAVSMAIGREPVQGVVRVSGVYTPPEKRKHGYAEACVHALSKKRRDAGLRCALYTDLGNPTSNSIYRRIGYRAVAETLRYRFE